MTVRIDSAALERANRQALLEERRVADRRCGRWLVIVPTALLGDAVELVSVALGSEISQSWPMFHGRETHFCVTSETAPTAIAPGVVVLGRTSPVSWVPPP